MNAKFSNHPGTILREDRLGLFTQSSFLPVHFHWTTTEIPSLSKRGGGRFSLCLLRVSRTWTRFKSPLPPFAKGGLV